MQNNYPAGYTVRFYQGMVTKKLPLGVPRQFLILLLVTTIYFTVAKKMFFVLPASVLLFLVVRYFYVNYDDNFYIVATRFFKLKKYYHG